MLVQRLGSTSHGFAVGIDYSLFAASGKSATSHARRDSQVNAIRPLYHASIRALGILAMFVGMLMTSGREAYAFDPVQSDLWDISQGTIVTSASDTEYYSPASNIFGGHNVILPDHAERSNTIFHDPAFGGQVFSVEWKTVAPVTIQSIVLNTAHDLPPRDVLWRGISRFALFAFNEASGSFDNKLFELYPANPYSETPETMENARVQVLEAGSRLSVAANTASTTAERFRAEFVMAGESSGSYLAPRIIELDGFPEPYPGIHPAIPGDTNNDHVIDLTDLNNVRNHFGEGVIQGPPVFGEAYPFDGRVDLGDLNLVRDYFGESSQLVPEPGSAAILTVGIVFATTWLARRKRCAS